MATRLSTKDLLEKCRRFVVADPTAEALDELIKDALITANREITFLDDHPLAWFRTYYDNLFTRSPATVSGITQASPGVVTADSTDSDITGHGYSDNDLILLHGLETDAMDELNDRTFRVNYVNDTTFSLYTIDTDAAVDCSGWDAYSSGGSIYHYGIQIPKTLIEPSTGTAAYQWKIGDVFSCQFDLKPTDPISEEEVRNGYYTGLSSAEPRRWRYFRKPLDDVSDSSSYEHFLLFYPVAGTQYNLRIGIRKDYPDLSWTDGTLTYPPHPADVHDSIWHRALYLLSANTEKLRREGKDGRIQANVEVMYSQRWKLQVMEDDVRTKRLSRDMLGAKATRRGFSG